MKTTINNSTVEINFSGINNSSSYGHYRVRGTAYTDFGTLDIFFITTDSVAFDEFRRDETSEERKEEMISDWEADLAKNCQQEIAEFIADAQLEEVQ